MNKFILPLLLLVGASTLLPSVAQKRAADQKTLSFQERIQKASGAWESGDYGTCMSQLQEAVGMCVQRRTDAILEAFPAAPAGWEALPDRKNDMRNNPLAAAMSASVGNIVKRSYKKIDGHERLEVTLTADSPMVSMFNMWITNPAMLGENGELIEYENDDKAVLKQEGTRLVLQIMISKAHMCEVRAPGMSEDELFAMFNQAAVDRLKKALGR